MVKIFSLNKEYTEKYQSVGRNAKKIISVIVEDRERIPAYSRKTPNKQNFAIL